MRGRSWRLVGLLVAAGWLCVSGPAYCAELAQALTVQQFLQTVVGVVGTGDQLKLQVRIDGQLRDLGPGDEYREGWRLQSISPTKVTVIKDGEAHEIGLNPTGAVVVGGPPPAPSEVTMLGPAADPILVQRAIDQGRWNGKQMIGLSMEESQIVAAGRQKGLDWAAEQRKARGLGEMASISFSPADQIAILGSREAYDQLSALESRTGGAKEQSWNGDALGFLQDRYDEYVTRLPAVSPDSQEYQQLVSSRDSVLQQMADIKLQRQTDPRAGFVSP